MAPGPEQESEERNQWPRITLITPVRNSAHYIEQTIRSVICQQYPNLEYFIEDGGSTDGTLDIIRKYEDQLSGWSSQPDNGMYDALNRGFARSTGEVMGWISATDLLHTRSLFVVGSVFRALPSVEWITGRPTGFSEEGWPVGVNRSLRRWSRWRFLAGSNRYIQQESTYWRRSLWERAGGQMDASRRGGSDFELWMRFFRYARLYSVNALIGGFRVHSDSLSLDASREMHRIHDEIIAAELSAHALGRRLCGFSAHQPRDAEDSRAERAVAQHGDERAGALPGTGLGPVIRYRDHTWTV